MLHRVNRPSYAPLLARVVEFEKKLLEWICTPPVAFTLADARRALGDDAQAEWLWERIERGGRPTDFGDAVARAIAHVGKSRSAGRRILRCAENDLDFTRHLDDAGYAFHEQRFPARSITADDLAAFKPLLVSLYLNLFEGAGFPAVIHHDNDAGNLTRAKWNANFWDSNPSLGFCPACNGQKPDKVRGKRSSDIDHFWPKEKYPFLSIHPDNLIPTCLTCNTKAHRDLDPLGDQATDTLLDTFHPYYCPAIDHIELCVGFKAGKGITVIIREHDGTRSKRIQNMVRIYDLEMRWADWFCDLLNTAIETMRITPPVDKTRDDLRTLLQDELNSHQRYKTARDKCFVHANLLKYVLNSSHEFDALCESYGL